MSSANGQTHTKRRSRQYSQSRFTPQKTTCKNDWLLFCVCESMSSGGGRQVPCPHKNTQHLFPSVPPLTFLSHVLSALVLHEELCSEKHVPQFIKLSHDSGIQRKTYPAVLISQMTVLLTSSPCFPISIAGTRLRDPGLFSAAPTDNVVFTARLGVSFSFQLLRPDFNSFPKGF